ncbi:MAG: aromatic-ring-hydroxylating dioxygenase subunit beta [Proteobacteria bacterium]|nr:aromatic-ring-hydroxylating dioxygenase subunit beta [Pseudomonadota bacterium]
MGAGEPVKDALTVPVTPDVLRECEVFLIEEACRLNEGRFDAWVDLFDDDGVYWVPSEPGQVSPHDTLSLFYESKALLRLRVQRLAHPLTHVQAPRSRTHHHVNSITAAELGDGCYVVRSLLLMLEWRAGEQTLFSARCSHELRRSDGGLRIISKRVDLLDCDAPHRAIAIPF